MMAPDNPPSIQNLSRRLEEAEASARALGAQSADPNGAPRALDRADVQRLRAIADDLMSALGTLDVKREVREAEGRYRLLGEQFERVGASVPGVICSFRLSPDGAISLPFSTPQVMDVLGLSQEALARSLDEHDANVPPDDRERLRASVLASARAMTTWRAVYRYNHPAKGLRWLEGCSLPAAQADGSILWHGFVTDVTERVVAEERVTQLTRIHRTLSDTNEAIVHATSEDALFQRVCEIAVEHLDLRGATVFVPDASGKSLVPRVACGPARETLLRLVVSIDVDGPLPPLGRAFVTNSVVAEGHFQRSALGRWREVAVEVGAVSAIGLPLRRGAQVVAVLGFSTAQEGAFDAEVMRLFEGMAQDISYGLDHLAQAAALRASEARFRSLVENQDDIVYAMDPEGRVTFISKAIARLGFAPQDLEGTGFEAHVHPQDRAALAAGFAEALRGRSAVVEHRIVDGTGKTRFLRGSMRPVIAGERVIAVQGVLTDLTRQHEAEEQLRLAQKMEAIGRLAGGVAHDFNNLLLVIMSYTELAMGALHAEDPVVADLDEVRKASVRAAGLTRQLLAFSRKQVMRTELIDLSSLVTGLEKMLRRLLGEDVDLVVRTVGSVQRTRADAGQIEQVVMNLAVNARDAMPNGGQLSIEITGVDLDPEAAAHVPDALPGPYLRLAISDTGTGMDEATQARVFEPFFTTKEAGKGTGLGLAMVYGIVKQSGGCIALRSELGKGTRFEIYFPVATSEREVEPARTLGAARRSGSETILLVEDEEVVRKLGRRLLSSAGYTVLVARTGPEALQICAGHRGPLHLLITDVVLPGMNGLELAQRLGALRPEIKVLYTSGYTDEAVAQRGALSPGAHFIGKPYLGDDLLREIRSVLGA